MHSPHRKTIVVKKTRGVTRLRIKLVNGSNPAYEMKKMVKEKLNSGPEMSRSFSMPASLAFPVRPLGHEAPVGIVVTDRYLFCQENTPDMSSTAMAPGTSQSFSQAPDPVSVMSTQLVKQSDR